MYTVLARPTKPKSRNPINFDNPEALLRKMICHICGELKSPFEPCQPCERRSKRRQKIRAKEIEAGLNSPAHHRDLLTQYWELQDEHLRVEERKQREKLMLLVVMYELRNCFKKIGENYIIPEANQPRLNRILEAVNVLANGWPANEVRSCHRDKSVDEFICGEFGPSWH